MLSCAEPFQGDLIPVRWMSLAFIPFCFYLPVAADIKGASESDLKVIRNLDLKFQTATSISILLDKTVVAGLLKQERKSTGHLYISKGKMRLEIEAPDKSTMVVDGKRVWVTSFPPAEFAKAAPQVLKLKYETKKGRSQGVLSLLSEGKFLKHFSVTGVDKGKNQTVYFLQPEQQSVEFKRAQALVSADGKTLQELRFWDEIDNETRFEFKKTDFNAKLKKELFNYTPPANADITEM